MVTKVLSKNMLAGTYVNEEESKRECAVFRFYNLYISGRLPTES
jgi:hypothetical protein